MILYLIAIIIIGVGMVVYYINLINPDFQVVNRVKNKEEIYFPRDPKGNLILIGVDTISSPRKSENGFLDSLLEKEE